MNFHRRRVRLMLPEAPPPEVAEAARVVAGHVAALLKDQRRVHPRHGLRECDWRRLRNAFVALDELGRATGGAR